MAITVLIKKRFCCVGCDAVDDDAWDYSNAGYNEIVHVYLLESDESVGY